FLLAIVPRRPLGGDAVAFEDPVAKLAAHGKDAPKEPFIPQLLQLQQPGQPQLVLHYTVLDARLLCRRIQALRLSQRGRDRLLAVDVLAGGNRALEQLRPQLRGSGVEEDFIRAVERRVEIGGPARDAMRTRKLLYLGRIAADQERIGNHARAVLERDAARSSDFQNRADQVLVHAHAPGDAVHDDAEAFFAHRVFISLIWFQSGVAALA